MVEKALHDLAPNHLPAFLPGPDGSDPLFNAVAIVAVLLVLGIGALYFTLHSLPEKIAHRSNSTQFQLIAVLALLALVTHNNLFWIIALLLAAIELPNFSQPLRSIAESLEQMREREK
ncbi:MAG: hypothetical protein AAF526_04115 [Pseudomonadota bacterium]